MIFAKENNFCTSWFVSLDNKALPKMVSSFYRNDFSVLKVPIL